jgi:hypothetical protein
MYLRLGVLALSAGCTLGATGRLEGTLDTRGHRAVAASLSPAFGATRIENGDVAHARGTFILIGIGGGWGGREGAFAMFSLTGSTVPGEGGGFGRTFGLHVRYSGRSCVHWSLGFGVTALLAQPRAESFSDPFGPSPRVTRIYHDATANVGFASCDVDVGEAGIAYEVTGAARLFDPGP